jgi:hypothetical protein
MLEIRAIHVIRGLVLKTELPIPNRRVSRPVLRIT